MPTGFALNPVCHPSHLVGAIIHECVAVGNVSVTKVNKKAMLLQA